MAKEQKWRQRCKAHSRRKGRQCKAWAVPGAYVCKWHGGNTPNARAAAAVRLATFQGAQAVAAAGPPSREQDPRHPMEHLLDELRWSAAVVEALGLQVGEDTAGAAYRAWSDERDRHARLAKLCLDAGVEERLVRITEQQVARHVALLARVIDATFRELHLPHDVAAKARAVMGEQFRRLHSEQAALGAGDWDDDEEADVA